jgi:shikimate 5-dehydrogenase
LKREKRVATRSLPTTGRRTAATSPPPSATSTTMMLNDKAAVIYGAGGAIGGAVARAFAREGAELFLTGRLRKPVEAVAEDIVAAGGSAEAAEVDALDERLGEDPCSIER